MNDSVPGSVTVDLRLGAVGRNWPANVGGRRYLTFASRSGGCSLRVET